jgi:hypothetical protein
MNTTHKRLALEALYLIGGTALAGLPSQSSLPRQKSPVEA